MSTSHSFYFLKNKNKKTTNKQIQKNPETNKETETPQTDDKSDL